MLKRYICSGMEQMLGCVFTLLLTFSIPPFLMLCFYPDFFPSVGPSLQFRDTQCRRVGERHRGASQKQDGMALGFFCCWLVGCFKYKVNVIFLNQPVDFRE